MKSKTTSKYKLLHSGIGVLSRQDCETLKKQDPFLKSSQKMHTVVNPLRLQQEPQRIVLQPQQAENAGQGGTRVFSQFDIGRTRVVSAVIFDLFFASTAAISVWLIGHLFPEFSQAAVRVFWNVARGLKLEWWIAAQGVPEMAWPIGFWSMVLMMGVQIFFVLLFGMTLGRSVFDVRLAQDGFWQRIGLSIAMILTFFGLLWLPVTLLFPARMPLFFWLRLGASQRVENQPQN